MQQMMDMLPSLVRGKVPLNVHREKVGEIDAQASNPDNHIHCLVIVLRLAAHLDMEIMDMVEKVTKKWIDMDLVSPVFVVTAIDQSEDLKDRADNIREMQQKLPAQQNVFFVESYTAQKTRCTKIDMQMRKVLIAIRDVSKRSKMIIINKYFGLSAANSPMLPTAATSATRSPSSSTAVPTARAAEPARAPMPSAGTAAAGGSAQSIEDLMARLNLNKWVPKGGVPYPLEDFRGEGENDVQSVVADFVFDKTDASRLAQEIVPSFRPKVERVQLRWPQFVPSISPVDLLQQLEASGAIPEVFKDSSKEEIAEVLVSDLKINKIRANAIARLLFDHFSVKNALQIKSQKAAL